MEINFEMQSTEVFSTNCLTKKKTAPLSGWKPTLFEGASESVQWQNRSVINRTHMAPLSQEEGMAGCESHSDNNETESSLRESHSSDNQWHGQYGGSAKYENGAGSVDLFVKASNNDNHVQGKIGVDQNGNVHGKVEYSKDF